MTVITNILKALDLLMSGISHRPPAKARRELGRKKCPVRKAE